MSDDVAESLHGYLNKEKSKTRFLRGLGGDVNRRYFRVQKIQGLVDLALCYYKHAEDPEVRGWVYLRDITEIAEEKDTMIISSTARTFHLYAETRAEHNRWVTGLVKLCPEAFVKLERNAPLLKKTNSVQPIPTQDHGEVPRRERSLFSTRKQDSDARLAHRKGPNGSNDPTHSRDGVVNNTGDTVFVDDDHCRRSVSQNGGSRSSNEDEQQDQSGKSEQVLSRASDGHSDAGKGGTNLIRYGASVALKGSTNSRRGAKDEKGDDQERKSSCQSGTRKREKYVALETEGSGDGQKEVPDIIQHGDDPESNTSKRVEEGSPRDDESVGSERRSRMSNAEGNDHVRSFATEDEHRRSDGCSSIGVENDSAKEPPSGEDIVEKHDVESNAAHDDLTEQPDLDPVGTDDDDESTINLDDGHDVGHQQRQSHERRNEPCIDSNEAGGLSPHVAKSRRSNQDDEGEVIQTEEGDIERSAPSFELSWERSRPSGKAAFRLHPHISGASGEGEGSRHARVLPPPKEFLSNHRSDSQFSRRRGQQDSSEAKDTKLGSIAKYSVKGRRRSAADLEWSDGEHPRQPRSIRLEEKLAAPADRGPVEVSDSEDDETGSDLNLEIEKQRRRATAAVQALQAAAKEADKADEADKGRVGKVRSWSIGTEQEDIAYRRNASNRKGTSPRKPRGKLYIPAPAGPPPAGSSRKARRSRGVPSPVIASPRLASSSGPSSKRRSDHGENYAHGGLDGDVKDDAHPRASPPLPAGGGSGGTPVSMLDAGVSNKATHWPQFDDELLDGSDIAHLD